MSGRHRSPREKEKKRRKAGRESLAPGKVREGMPASIEGQDKEMEKSRGNSATTSTPPN